MTKAKHYCPRCKGTDFAINRDGSIKCTQVGAEYYHGIKRTHVGCGWAGKLDQTTRKPKPTHVPKTPSTPHTTKTQPG